MIDSNVISSGAPSSSMSAVSECLRETWWFKNSKDVLVVPQKSHFLTLLYLWMCMVLSLSFHSCMPQISHIRNLIIFTLIFNLYFEEKLLSQKLHIFPSFISCSLLMWSFKRLCMQNFYYSLYIQQRFFIHVLLSLSSL